MFRRFLSASALAVILVLTNSAASYSQTNFDSVVSFGDSLSDNGNLFAFNGTPASPPYFNGRVSNGPTWVELLNGPMDNSAAIFLLGVAPGTVVTGTDNQNWAIAGARSDNNPNPPGLLLQVPTYLGTVGGAIPSNTLFTVLAGANDAFDLFGGAPTPATIVADATAAGVNVSNGVNQLLAAGADNILVANLPNLGATPDFIANGALAQQGGALYSQTENSVIDAQLQSLAASNPTANIVKLDLAALFELARKNPEVFGLTNVTQQCLATGCTNPNQFLFWDGVHPTAFAHSIIAQFAILTLGFADTAAETAAFGEIGTWARLNATDAVFDRAMSWIHGTYAQQNGLYAEVIGIDGDIDASGNRTAYDYGLYGVRGGLDKQIGNFLIGGSAAFLSGDLNSGAIESELIVVQSDLYVSTYMEPFFATAEIGAAVSAINDIERNTGLANIKTDDSTSGYQYGAAAEAGALFQIGSISIIPAGRIEYIGGHIAGYDENAPLLAKSYQDRDMNAFLASGRVRVATKLAAAGIPTSLFGEIGYEEFISYDEDNINVSLFNNTALPVSIAVDDPDARGLYFKTGINGSLNDTVSFDVNYGYSSHNGDGDIHSGKLRLKIRN